VGTLRTGALSLALAALASACAASAAASYFGFARIRAASRTEPYGAVTFRPFSAGRGAVIPLLVLVDHGDYSRPWLRAKHVAQLLPKAVELMLAGEIIKVGPDADGHPGLFVGPPERPISRADLQLVSVLPGDVLRFRRERSETRTLGQGEVARYWKLLLEDLVTVFVRFPLARDPALADRLNLARTRSGVLFKRVLVEVGVLLRYEDLSLEKASATQIKAKTLEVLDAMTQEQWAQLADLAFRIPAELDPIEAAASPGPAPLPIRTPVDPEAHAGGTPPDASADASNDAPDPGDGDPTPSPSPVSLYVEPDRTVWPGGSARPPSPDELRGSGESATKGIQPEESPPVEAAEPAQ
jgi:hypothetical protein